MRAVRPALVVPLCALSGALAGCPAHIDPRRDRVDTVNFHGVSQVSEDDLRERLALRETAYFPGNRPRWLRWWRWWWRDPEYFDETLVTRDRLRIARYYQARGFYDAEVSAPRLSAGGQRLTLGDDASGAPRPSGGRDLTLDFDVTERLPTLVADVRLRGCQGGEAVGLPEDACRAIRERLTLQVGQRFDEAAFAYDREQVLDFTREAGFATPTVVPRATVDPAQRMAWVEYTIRPGPQSRFRRVRLFPAGSTTPVTGDELPGGLPVGPVLSAIAIEPGTRYSRTLLAAAQQSLFNLGVFGIARIEEVLRPDGDVDLDVTLSPSRVWRLRAGAGAEADSSRTNVHALATFDHRNFLGGMRRLRIDVRPQVFFGSILSGGVTGVVEPGLSSTVEIQQPEISAHTTGIARATYEIGPDPLNPSVAYRSSLTTAIGLEARLSRQLSGSFFLRTTNAVYCPFRADEREQGGIFPHDNCGNRPTAQLIDSDPILRQQFFDRNYVHFEQSVSWDRRDNPASPTRGTLFTLNLAEGTRSPLSDYTFLRMQFEARGFVPIRRGLTLALRGVFGAIVGSSVYLEAGRRWAWPVPPELRFYSGGTQSNRGYPLNRVGVLGASAIRTPWWNGGVRAYDDPNKVVAVGGTAMWEGSVELRWQPGAFGVVLFLDASNVTGIDPTPFLSPVGVNGVGSVGVCQPPANNFVTDHNTCVRQDQAPLTAAPPPQPLGRAVASLLEFSSWDAFVQSVHPSVGIGLRYATPVGPVRLDVGLRLADINCTLAQRNVNAQTNAVASQYPSYYLLSGPRCDLLGFDVPATIHFSIGEAY
ncbi:MAG: BamA/TamA family outer membrane protein [Polyangiales bacterium]